MSAKTAVEIRRELDVAFREFDYHGRHCTCCKRVEPDTNGEHDLGLALYRMALYAVDRYRSGETDDIGKTDEQMDAIAWLAAAEASRAVERAIAESVAARCGTPSVADEPRERLVAFMRETMEDVLTARGL